MLKRTAFAGFVALLFIAGCAKQGPAPAQDSLDNAGETVAAPAPSQPKMPRDYYARTAQGVMSLLADAPECQRWHDELQSIIDAPAGTIPREPAEVVAAAHTAGCSKKARGQ